MEDWKDEQLSSKYFVSKLKSASEQVNTFVQGEVPSGWTCVWDRYSRFVTLYRHVHAL